MGLFDALAGVVFAPVRVAAKVASTAIKVPVHIINDEAENIVDDLTDTLKEPVSAIEDAIDKLDE